MQHEMHHDFIFLLYFQYLYHFFSGFDSRCLLYKCYEVPVLGVS
nr:MAG TPA: hypothetical protein [Bacteriophage sp.]